MLNVMETPPPVSDDDPSELTPRILPLSPDARALWIATADAIEERLGPGGPLEGVRAFANKAPEHAARTAAVITLVEDLNAV